MKHFDHKISRKDNPFSADTLTERQASAWLGVDDAILAAWRTAKCGPPFVAARTGAFLYPRVALQMWLRDALTRFWPASLAPVACRSDSAAE